MDVSATKRQIFLATSLIDCFEDANLSGLESLMSYHKADPSFIVPYHGVSPFHLLVGHDNTEFAKAATNLFLKYKSDVNSRCEEGMSPLHVAAVWGKREIVKMLLQAGADVNLTDNDGNTALEYAIEEKQWDVVEDITAYQQIKDINCGASVSSCSIDSDTSLLNGSSKTRFMDNQSIGDSSLYKNNKQHNTTESFYYNPSQRTDQSGKYLSLHEKYSKIRNNLSAHHSAIDGLESSAPDNCTIEKDNVKRSVSIDVDKNDKTYLLNKNFMKSSKSSLSPIHADLLKLTYLQESGVTPLDSYKFSDLDVSRNNNKKLSLENKDYNCILTSDQSDCGLLNTIERYCSYSNKFCQTNNNEIDINIRNTPCENKNVSIGNPVREDMKIFKNSQHMAINSLGEDNPVQLCKAVLDDARYLDDDHLPADDDTFVSVSEYKYTDIDEGIVLIERRCLPVKSVEHHSSCSASSSTEQLPLDYDTDTLRGELTALGYSPGPITKTTKRVYLKKLVQLHRNQPVHIPCGKKRVYTLELEKTFKNPDWHDNLSNYIDLEQRITEYFSNSKNKKWRGGVTKSSFTYLLLDPRLTQNLPIRAQTIPQHELWKIFLSAIFYVGKGKRSRPYQHLYQSVTLWNKGISRTSDQKIQHILNIWKEQCGVVCLHIFQNVIAVEAHTREAAMIDVIGLVNLKNLKSGEYYGLTMSWTRKQKQMLGVYLLYRAMQVFLNEGERQLLPADIE